MGVEAATNGLLVPGDFAMSVADWDEKGLTVTKPSGRWTEMSYDKKLENSTWWTGTIVKGKRIRIRVDHDYCMGSGTCIIIAPKVFQFDWSKRKSNFMSSAPLEVVDEKGADPETTFLAAQSCPYRAIIVEDADTGEQLFP